MRSLRLLPYLTMLAIVAMTLQLAAAGKVVDHSDQQRWR